MDGPSVRNFLKFTVNWWIKSWFGWKIDTKGIRKLFIWWIAMIYWTDYAQLPTASNYSMDSWCSLNPHSNQGGLVACGNDLVEGRCMFSLIARWSQNSCSVSLNGNGRNGAKTWNSTHLLKSVGQPCSTSTTKTGQLKTCASFWFLDTSLPSMLKMIVKSCQIVKRKPDPSRERSLNKFDSLAAYYAIMLTGFKYSPRIKGRQFFESNNKPA